MQLGLLRLFDRVFNCLCRPCFDRLLAVLDDLFDFVNVLFQLSSLRSMRLLVLSDPLRSNGVCLKLILSRLLLVFLLLLCCQFDLVLRRFLLLSLSPGSGLCSRPLLAPFLLLLDCLFGSFLRLLLLFFDLFLALLVLFL